MSDPEVPQPENKSDVDDVVDSANAGLADAEAARAEVADSASTDSTAAASDAVVASDADASPDAVVASDAVAAPDADAASESRAASASNDAGVDYQAVDPDLAAFEAAERDHPGTFAAPEPTNTSSAADDRAAATDSTATSEPTTEPANTTAFDRPADSSIAETAYLPPAADEAETRVVPSEPVRSEPEAEETAIAATPLQHQPIFVQAPEAPRPRGNRGTAAGIGLLATIVFAVLYLGTALGLGALAGDVTGENIGEAALSPLTTWGFWVPVAVFFIGFWLLGAIINRGRWGLWVVFGIIVGLFAWAGHLLGQLFEAPFWELSTREGGELISGQLFAPLAIAAFVFGRELTIWFGAWVARSGARKTVLNDEAQLEYERTIEAGPTLSR